MKKILWRVLILFFVVMNLEMTASENLFAKDIHIAIIDSGATGYVDFGKSFTSFPANSDPLNHGTYIAKLIRSANPHAQITMLQVCTKERGQLKPSRSAILKAIQWAVDNDIDVVNMSLVVKYDQAIEKAIVEASTSHGVLFVAAAGNKTIASRFATDSSGYIRRTKRSAKPAFPASSPHVISVGSIDNYGKITSYSDKNCDVYANGEIIGQKGTSFSSARITAKVAKILSDYPYSSAQEVLAYLKS